MKKKIEVGKSYTNKSGESVEIIYRLAIYSYVGIINEEEIHIYNESGESEESSFGDDIVFESEYSLEDTVILKDGRKVVINSIERLCCECIEVGKNGVKYVPYDLSDIARKATKEEVECSYQDGELCLIKLCNVWQLRFSNGAGRFYTKQNIGGLTAPHEEHKSAFPLTELPD